MWAFQQSWVCGMDTSVGGVGTTTHLPPAARRPPPARRPGWLAGREGMFLFSLFVPKLPRKGPQGPRGPRGAVGLYGGLVFLPFLGPWGPPGGALGGPWGGPGAPLFFPSWAAVLCCAVGSTSGAIYTG